MVTIDDIEAGISAFLDSELAGQFPENSIQKVLIAGAIALAIKRMGAKIRRLQDDPAIQFLGIFDAEGNIDIDEAYSCIKEKWPEAGARYENSLLGGMTITVADLEKLYNLIKQQGA